MYSYIKDLIDKNNVDEGHNIEHFITVRNHAFKACVNLEIDESIKEMIYTAAFLHDIDDYKFFKTQGNENARNIIREFDIKGEEEICKMINLVSCSKNLCSDYKPEYYLIVRDCDRLEAIGAIGLYRAYIYSLNTKRPIYSEEKHPTSIEEIMERIDDQRFLNYKGNSLSLMDHFFDKVVHIGLEKNLKSNNPYIIKVANKRFKEMCDIVLKMKEIAPTNDDYEKLGEYLKSML